jgi:hypothetical protein
MRLPLNVHSYAGRLQKGVPIVEEISELARHVFLEIIPQQDTRSETIANARLCPAFAGKDGAVAIEPITDFRADLELLRLLT